MDERRLEKAYEKNRDIARRRESQEKQTKQTRENALERGERREWANKKFGDERRWRE